MKIAFAAVEYDPEIHEPQTPFFYEADVWNRSLPVKQIAENLAKAILDQEEHDLKDGGEESGEISIDPRSSWGDIEIDLGSGNSLFLAFPKGYEAVRKAFKKLPKSKLIRAWGIEDGDQEDE